MSGADTKQDVDAAPADVKIDLEGDQVDDSGRLEAQKSWPSSLHSSPDNSPNNKHNKGKEEPQTFKDPFYNQFGQSGSSGSHDNSDPVALPSKQKKVKASKAKLAKRASGAESRNDIKKYSGRGHGGFCCFGLSKRKEPEKKKKSLAEINAEAAEQREARAQAAAEVEALNKERASKMSKVHEELEKEQSRRNSNASLTGQNKEGEPINDAEIKEKSGGLD